MKYETRPVRDREEWIEITRRAEGGVYTMAGFLAFDPAAPPMSRLGMITDRGVVERAFAGLRRELGWDRFAGVGGPIVAQTGLVECGAGSEERIVGTVESEIFGGWWLIVPVDYAERLGDVAEFCFVARAHGQKTVAFFALELVERLLGKITVPEFATTVEFARINGKVCVFSDHPDAPLIARYVGRSGGGDGA